MLTGALDVNEHKPGPLHVQGLMTAARIACGGVLTKGKFGPELCSFPQSPPQSPDPSISNAAMNSSIGRLAICRTAEHSRSRLSCHLWHDWESIIFPNGSSWRLPI